MLVHMAHRGGTGCEPSSGDGAGIMLGLPHDYYAQVCQKEFGLALPAPGNYGTGLIFMPADTTAQSDAKTMLTSSLRSKGFEVQLLQPKWLS